jgi:hypothetical protein
MQPRGGDLSRGGAGAAILAWAHEKIVNRFAFFSQKN